MLFSSGAGVRCLMGRASAVFPLAHDANQKTLLVIGEVCSKVFDNIAAAFFCFRHRVLDLTLIYFCLF